MSQLSKKEKAFCERYFETGDIEEAVRFSGISKNPYELLRRADVTNEIKRLGESVDKNIEAIAKNALVRLMTGNISDAVGLLYSDKPDIDKLKELDLFMISEIKRKGDVTEIKFFDRFKAIKSLLEGFNSGNEAVPFYDALIEGARKLGNEYGD